MITKEAVLKALGNVDDPDLGKDLVTLNMVKDIEIAGNNVSFTVVLTTPACPMKEMIEKACINAVKMLVNREAEVTVNMTSNVNSNRKDNLALLPNVKNILAVASGKGGVGKSTISVNLALALAEEGAKVGILEGVIYGPSIPIMLGLGDDRPKMIDIEGNGKGKIVPIEKYGVKAMSIGLLVDEKQAVVWRGPIASSALKQFIRPATGYGRCTPDTGAGSTGNRIGNCIYAASGSCGRRQEGYHDVQAAADKHTYTWCGGKYGVFHTC